MDYERALVGTAIFIESEMALFSECMVECARKLLDTADIVREASRVENRRSGFSLSVAIGLAFACPPQSGLA